MPTKFYFIQDLPNYRPPTWAGGWDQIGTAPGLDGDPGIHQSIDPDKYGDGAGSMLGSVTLPSTPYRKGIVQCVSRPLLPQTISGTVDLVYAVRENVVGADLYTRLHLYVINCTTHAVHGTLLNQYEESSGGGGVEWPTGTTYPGRSLQAVQTLTPVTIPSDGTTYRLVVEVGCIAQGAVSTAISGYLSLGARTGTTGALKADLTVGFSPGAQRAGYLEFSGVISLAPHPLPNIGPETATLIAPLPFAVTFDPLKAGGTYGVEYLNGGGYWYQFVASANLVLSVLCSNPDPQDANLILYHAVTPGTGPPLQEDVTLLQLNPEEHKHVQYWTVKTGDVVYLRVWMNTYAPGNTLTLSVEAGVQETVLAGDLLIPTDDDGVNKYDATLSGAYQSVVYAPTGIVRHITGTFPGGELGVSLGNGKFGLAGKRFVQWQRKLWIFDTAPSLAKLAEAELPGAGSAIIIALGTDFSGFYAALAPDFASNGPSTVYKIGETGVIDATTFGPLPVYPIGLIAGGSNASMGVSRDGTVLYYGHTTPGGALKRYHLPTNTPLSDVAPPTGPAYRPGDVIVLRDNTIVTMWSYEPAPVSQKITHHAPDGTLLRTIDFGSTYGRIHHLVHDPEDGTSKIWVWAQDTRDANFPNAFSYFLHVNLTTGLTETSFAHHHSVTGGLGVSAPANAPERWVSANCCPLLMMMGPIDDGGNGGGNGGGGNGDHSCLTAPPLAACWAPHDPNATRIGLIAEDTQP